MDDIPASASKENPELFGSASIGGQPSCRETYTHSNFTAQHSNINCRTPNLFNSPRGTSHHQQTGIFDRYCNDPVPETPAPQLMNGGQPDSLDTISDDEEEPETPTHTPHWRNPDDDPPDNHLTTNPAAQTALEDQVDQEPPVGLVDQMALVALEVPTMVPTSRISCKNS
ncbi:hypothetical protein EV421DRAFT_1913286 [Armillaria borealis]|uniref:Uncharacterized protein n=1 Tax=Armillaria borealis TaxID=47425 RepID=A0AA39MDT2_9AGAR|nr:hypothetical protein EV421DRAFT_1913286 [Armillaria borealis]